MKAINIRLTRVWALAFVASLVPAFSFAVWTYDMPNHTITDGNWLIPVNATVTEFMLNAPTQGSGVLDLTTAKDDMGKDVVRVTTSAFKNNTAITAFIAPEMKMLDTSAFQGATELAQVVLSSEVTYISNSAFNGCTKLASLSPTEYPACTTVGQQAFYNTPLLHVSLSFPAVTEFPINGFNACGLTGISASNLTTLGKYCFRDCTSLGGDVSFPQMSSPILSHTFANTKIRSAFLPLATGVGDHAFSHCESLERVTLSDAVANIGGYAFEWCTNMTEFAPLFPKSLKTLEAYAFSRCYKLPSKLKIECPELTSVPANVFYSASGLFDKVTVKSNLTTLQSLPCKAGCQLYFDALPPTFAYNSISASGRCFISVKNGADSSAWQAVAAPYAETFETLKTQPDYPGKDAFGVVYTGPSASYLSNLSFYHWLINVRPNGLILMVR